MTDAPSRRDPAVALASHASASASACAPRAAASSERSLSAAICVSTAPTAAADSTARASVASARSSSPARWWATPSATSAVGSQTPPGGTASYAAAASSSICPVPSQQRSACRSRRLGSSRRQAPLRGVGPPLGVGRASAQRMDPRADQAQVGMAVECRQLVQQAQPPLDHDDASFLVRRQRKSRHEMRDVVEIARRRGVVDRGLRRAVRLAPVRRPAVQHRHELGLPALELGAEEVAHEAAVAVRAPAAVERHDEETGRARARRAAGRSPSARGRHRRSRDASARARTSA